MTDSGDSDDSIDIEIRSVESVAKRCIILTTMLRRIAIESSISSNEPNESLTAAFDLREWIRAEGLWADLTPYEAAHLENKAGYTPPDTAGAVDETSEAIAALCWAMGLTEMLSEGHTNDLVKLIVNVPSPWENTAPWIAQRTLRPEEQVAHMRERAEIWEWRLAIEPARRNLQGSELQELNETLFMVARDSYVAGYIQRENDSGFAINAAPVSKMTLDDINEMRLIAQSKLRALNWLCGFGDDWVTVPLDV